jgi:hypothetical protein
MFSYCPSKPPIPEATYLMCSYTDINITRERERERERGILQNKATKYFTRIS